MNINPNNIEFCQRVKDDIEEFSNHYAKKHLKKCPNAGISEAKCKKFAANLYMQKIVESNEMCSLLECPAKFAKSSFDKINKKTIKKALNASLYHCNDCCELHNCKNLHLNYLTGTCDYCRDLAVKSSATEIEAIILANFIQTFGLPKRLFEEFLDFVIYDSNKMYSHKDKLWDVALSLPKGLACKYNCQQKTNFCSCS